MKFYDIPAKLKSSSLHPIQMLQPKTVHYPSGFPMPQTPPVFICSSPGPDPYESNDNLYEELDQPDSQSDMSHNDSHRTIPHTVPADRMSDNLNSSADTASVTDEIANNNEIATSSSNTNTTNSLCNRNMTVAVASGVNENEVERRNHINVQMSNTAFSVATIFRDRNNMRFGRQHQQHHQHPATTTRANANYYAPSHNMTMNINGVSSNRVNISDSNCQFLTNPRAMHCWGNTAQYEPVLPSVYNSQCLASNNYHHHQNGSNETQHFATTRSFNSLRSPHHINQNTISSTKNLWSWFRRVRT
ncbi:hypothetical protein ACKWTF_007663 [Chironomus riparius]